MIAINSICTFKVGDVTETIFSTHQIIYAAFYISFLSFRLPINLSAFYIANHQGILLIALQLTTRTCNRTGFLGFFSSLQLIFNNCYLTDCYIFSTTLV